MAPFATNTFREFIASQSKPNSAKGMSRQPAPGVTFITDSNKRFEFLKNYLTH